MIFQKREREGGREGGAYLRHSTSYSSADQRADISRVLHPVQDENEGRKGERMGGGGGGGGARDDCKNALLFVFRKEGREGGEEERLNIGFGTGTSSLPSSFKSPVYLTQRDIERYFPPSLPPSLFYLRRDRVTRRSH